MAGKKAFSAKNIPAELEGVATVQDVSAMQDKLDKCYTSERYEDFQTVVEKIIWRWFKGFLGFAVFLWLASLLASMLAQKYLHILG